jgi:hypothetical protein
MALLAVVDGDALLEVVWSSVLGGLGVTAVYGVAIFGATRAVDASRGGRGIEAAIMGVLCAIALAVVAAAIVFGILVMTDK